MLLERGTAIALEGSGNAAGIFHGVVHRGDGRHARFHRAAAFAARAAVRESDRRPERAAASPACCASRRRREPAELQATIDALGLPADYVRAIDADAASRLAGVPIAAAAWHFPHGGWVDPRGLAAAWLARAGKRCELRLGCPVATLARVDDRWALRDAKGNTVATASCVVLCNAGGALELLGRPPWPIEPQRGQVSSVAAVRLAPGTVPRLPVAGAGYVLPEIGGAVWFGASPPNGTMLDLAVRASDHRANLETTRSASSAVPPHLRWLDLSGRAGVRWLSRDRLPVIGAVPAALAESAGLGVVAALGGPCSTSRASCARAPGLFVFARARLARHRVGGARRRRCWPRRSPVRRCRSRPTCSMRSIRRAS